MVFHVLIPCSRENLCSLKTIEVHFIDFLGRLALWVFGRGVWFSFWGFREGCFYYSVALSNFISPPRSLPRTEVKHLSDKRLLVCIAAHISVGSCVALAAPSFTSPVSFLTSSCFLASQPSVLKFSSLPCFILPAWQVWPATQVGLELPLTFLCFCRLLTLSSWSYLILPNYDLELFSVYLKRKKKKTVLHWNLIPGKVFNQTRGLVAK